MSPSGKISEAMVEARKVLSRLIYPVSTKIRGRVAMTRALFVAQQFRFPGGRDECSPRIGDGLGAVQHFRADNIRGTKLRTFARPAPHRLKRGFDITNSKHPAFPSDGHGLVEIMKHAAIHGY